MGSDNENQKEGYEKGVRIATSSEVIELSTALKSGMIREQNVAVIKNRATHWAVVG